MTLVSNSTKSPLILPTGERIDPGGSTEVADWAKAQESAQVARWVETGALVEGELPPPTGEPPVEHVETNVGNVEDAETIRKLDMPRPYDYTAPPVNETDPPPPETETDTESSSSRRRRSRSEEE